MIIKLGSRAIELFNLDIGDNHDLWNKGWTVYLQKLGGFKYLVWKNEFPHPNKEEENG